MGVGLPELTRRTLAPSPPVAIWVMERLSKSLLLGLQEGVHPGRNSCTWPSTRTSSPMATVGTELVKTKTPSDVESLESGWGSWM